MQWFEVAQADEIEELTPLILNQVASVAEAVDDIAFGTANGPTRFGPLLRVVSAASTMVRVEGPPDPMMMPVRSLRRSVRARRRGSPAPSRRGSRLRRRQGSASPDGRPPRKDRARAHRAP